MFALEIAVFRNRSVSLIGIYSLNVNSRNSGTVCEFFSKLTINMVSLLLSLNSHIVLVLSSLSLKKLMPSGVGCTGK